MMAITKIDFPTASTAVYTPDIETDYNNQNEYIERNARGYNAISLTNWDSSTIKPQVAAGSVIEINGATWDITTATDISTSGATSGVIYLYFDDGTPEFKFLDTAPTWSATLNGWYNSGDRFTGHLMAWNGGSIYLQKSFMVKNSERYSSYDKLRVKGVLVNEFLGSLTASFSDCMGMTFDGTNIISIAGAANLVKIHTGVTTSVSSSFATPAAQPRGIGFDGTNIITTDSVTGLIYIHVGITSSVSSSFASPASDPRGLTVIGGNLISADGVTNLIYIHSGITSSVSSSFATPGSSCEGLGNDGVNLFSVDLGTRKLYYHSGLTNTILTSRSLIADNGNRAVVSDGYGTILGNNVSNLLTYHGIR